MPRGIMVVQSSPAPGREDEYDHWYSDAHIPEVCAIPGFVGARRFKVHQDPDGEAGAPAHAYLSIYEIEADDLMAPVHELRARSAAGQMTRSDAMQTERPAVVTYYELIE
ncbi:MAG: DUF4286 family protein [Acidimicrobiales bacterium]